MGKTMSSFLDEPVTKKESTDECSNKFICGTSSMQGWRESQEDAHNCILEYDKDAAFFAVYDGHGGAEVSEYCSLKLPEYIKNNDDYKNDKIEDALVNCFLSFDQIFKTTDFADELNKLRPPKESDDDDNNSVVEENFDNLYKEAAMPIEQVIEKYTTESLKMKKTNDQNCNETNADTSACCSSSASSSSSTTKASTSQITPSETNSDGVSSSSESSQCTSNTDKIENDTKNHVPDSSDMDKETTTTTTTTTTQNGNNDDKQNSEAIAKNDDNESKNGEILPKDKGKNVVKPEQTIRKSPRQKAAQIYKQFLENGSEEDDDSDSDSEEGESFESVTVESSEDECVNTAIEVDGEDSSEEVQDDDDDEADEDEDEDDDDDEYDDDDLFHRYRAGYNSGCTAVVALLKGLELYVANIGDSRCIVCRNGEIIEMSFDHKPTDDPELERIKKAGGRVFDERVEGGLNLSRAFGDHSYKKNKQLSDREQMITALPDIKKLTLKPNEDEFMFLACDGIWNSMTTEECVDFIRTRLQEGREKLSQICEEMFDSCLATDPNYDSKGNDNMTAVLIKFKWNIPKRGPSSPSSHTESDAKRIKIDDNSIPQIDTTV